MISLVEEYIESGNSQALAQLLSTDPELLQLKTSRKMSPLLHACCTRNQEIVDTILEHQVELDLFEAAASGRFDWLAHQVSKISLQTTQYADNGYTALGLSVEFGHEELVRYLLIKEMDVNVPMDDSLGNYPLHLAVLHQKEIIAKMLLEAGARVNISQTEGLSPLHLAAKHGNIELIIQLLEAGATVKGRTREGKTAGDLADEAGWKDLARILND
ncbi:MAG: hypothetical protein RI924_1070 [Bacteroidota bacterium]|jgi:ankyrin repeat protein